MQWRKLELSVHLRMPRQVGRVPLHFVSTTLCVVRRYAGGCCIKCGSQTQAGNTPSLGSSHWLERGWQTLGGCSYHRSPFFLLLCTVVLSAAVVCWSGVPQCHC